MKNISPFLTEEQLIVNGLKIKATAMLKMTHLDDEENCLSEQAET
jgi:hypothetical protein